MMNLRTKILTFITLTAISAIGVGILVYQDIRWKATAESIYSIIKHEPVPLPYTTPFGYDTKNRQAYSAGFKVGYDEGLRRNRCSTPPPPEYSEQILSTAYSNGRWKGFLRGYKRSREYERNQQKQ